MNILLNAKHELRSGWKFTAYWVLFVILLFAISIAVPLGTGPQTQLERLILVTVTFPPAVVALWLMLKFVDKAPMAVFGVTFHERWFRDFNVGLVIAAGMLSILVVTTGIWGGFTMLWTGTDAAARSLIVTIAVLIIAAAQEELIFRGYPLQVLMKGIGPWPAILTMSTMFGLVHLMNDNATIVGAINTMLAGVMLSIAYLRTRSLWLPYGLHLGWNVGLGFVLGYPLSGIKVDSLWTKVARAPRWLIGSEYGPEGGIIGTIIFGAVSVLLYRTRAVGISPRIQSLLTENASKIYVSEKSA